MPNPRPFWSGTIAFGLVSLPVSLFTANLRNAVSLRMLDEDGTPLSRRYFCSQEEKVLSWDEIVRGYAVKPKQFIEVTEDELDALEPEKSQEIDLRRFVPVDDIDPMYFERAYFLIPDKGAIKAYRLLAESLEAKKRAGIATVVMRGKEYLVALIAQHGILRVETMRFHDELRSPEDIGLPPLAKAAAAEVKHITKAIKTLASDKLADDALSDTESKKLLALVEKKLAAGEDVVAAPEQPEQESAEIIDLMAILKAGLEEGSARKKSTKKKASKHAAVNASMTKAALYERAKQRDIAGRSTMSKKELLAALRDH